MQGEYHQHLLSGLKAERTQVKKAMDELPQEAKWTE